jgi:hypothetical protein
MGKFEDVKVEVSLHAEKRLNMQQNKVSQKFFFLGLKCM